MSRDSTPIMGSLPSSEDESGTDEMPLLTNEKESDNQDKGHNPLTNILIRNDKTPKINNEYETFELSSNDNQQLNFHMLQKEGSSEFN